MTALICWTSPCAANDWDDYQSLLNKYYFIDDQPVSHLECRIATSSLDPAGFRSMLKSAENNIEIVQNIDEFKVRYSKGIGFSFVEPAFKVKLKSAEGVADLPRLLDGLDQFNKGVAGQIAGVRNVVQGTLDDLLLPRREELRGLKVTALNEQVVVQYATGAGQTRHEYAAGKRRTRTPGAFGGAPTEAVDEFSLLDGKWAISNTSISTKTGNSDVRIERAIQYQMLGHVSFPSVIETRTRLEGPSTHQDSVQVIKIDQCVSR